MKVPKLPLIALGLAIGLSTACLNLNAAAPKKTGRGGASELLPPAAKKESKPAEQDVVMSCPKCKDNVRVHRDMTARGANKPMVTTVTHMCDECGSKLVKVGHGKMAKETRVHTCAHCAPQPAGQK